MTVPPAPLLVLEGVGSGSPAYADLVTVLVWVEAPPTCGWRAASSATARRSPTDWRQWAVDEQRALRPTPVPRERADASVLHP